MWWGIEKERALTATGAKDRDVLIVTYRLEVWSPGALPPPLTLEKIRQPHGSVPVNPLIAEPLYLTKYIERMGTGDMIERCRAAGLEEPEFRITDGFVTVIRRKPERAFLAVGGEVADKAAVQVTMEVGNRPGPSWDQVGTKLGLSAEQAQTLRSLTAIQEITELMAIIGRTNRTKFRDQVLNPLIAAGLVEMTIPDKPRSSKQKYRLTEKGRQLLKAVKESSAEGSE